MQRDTLDLWWGGVLALFGLVVTAYAATHYQLGTPRQMGPGFFPVALGLVLAGLGAMIAVPAWSRAGQKRPFAWREMLVVSASLLMFGLMLDRVGIVITTALTVLLASSVAPRKGFVWRLVLCATITGLTWAVFVLALRMPIPVWPRSF